MQKAVEKALSDIFFVGFDGALTRFKYAFYYFVEEVLTEMASKRSLNDMFERNLER